MSRRALAICACLWLAGAAGATDGAAPPPNDDPWEGYNRTMFKFNMAVDHAVFRPVARGYKAVVPSPVRTGVSNFFSNLMGPLHMVNDLLQGKPGRAASDLGRFLVNTTVGIGGLFDPASKLDLKQSDEDFGQTLGKWGVGSGPYLVLPFLPPTTLRDAFGQVPDYHLDPVNHLERDESRYELKLVELVDARARVLDLDEAIDTAYDPYAFVRDAWLQRREYKVKDGMVPASDEDYYDDPAEDPAPAPTPAIPPAW